MLFTPVLLRQKEMKRKEEKRREEKTTGFFQKAQVKKAPNSTRNAHVRVKLKQLTRQHTTLRVRRKKQTMRIAH
jgi:hypothetical protein